MSPPGNTRATTRTWVVRAGDPPTVGALVDRAFGDGAAIAEGRVFLGRVRVLSADQAVSAGDEVKVASAASAVDTAGTEEERRDSEVRVLHHGGDFVAVHKPAGVVTIPDLHGSAHALSTRVARMLDVDAHQLHPTSRLDREVSGVVVFTLTRDAAARLAEARERGHYERRYLAIAGRARGSEPLEDHGRWDVPIGRDRDPKKRKVRGRDAVAAATRYAVVARSGSHALLALGPETGRTHQLRVHASHAGMPLLGDRAYGGEGRLSLDGGRVVALDRIFLHAARVTIPADGGGLVTIVDEVPLALTRTWALLGGEPDAWDTGLACPLESPPPPSAVPAR